MMLANDELRKTARRFGVPLWMVAAEMGISEPTMTRRLRRELPEAEQRKILNIVSDLAQRKEAEAHENAGN